MLLFTLISNSSITGPLCNSVKAQRLPPKSHGLPNFRTPGKELVLGGCSEEQKMTVDSLFPPYWHRDCWYCKQAMLPCFPEGQWKAGTPSWSKETGVSGGKKKAFVLIDCVHLNGKSRQGDWQACSSQCQVSWFLILEQSTPAHTAFPKHLCYTYFQRMIS